MKTIPLCFTLRRFFLLLGTIGSFLVLLQAKATAQIESPTAGVDVLFNHGESPGANPTSYGVYAASISATDPDAANLYFGSGSASVTATPLGNGANSELPSLHATANPEAQGNSEEVASTADFEDDLYFQTTNSTTPPVFHFNFLVTGSLTGNSQAQLNVQWGNVADGGQIFTTSSVAQEFTLAIPAGDLDSGPGSLPNTTLYSGTFEIYLTASANNTAPNSFTLESSSANFSNTVELVSADADDSHGNPINGNFSDGAQILFPSNTVFVSTPEPNGSLMILSGLSLLGLWKMRLRSTSCL